jgi:hypothetical protein
MLADGAGRATFETASAGSVSGFGGGGAADNLAWLLTGGGSAQQEAGLSNPPSVPGTCLHLHQAPLTFSPISINLMTENIDLSGVPNERVVVSIDFRTYDDSSTSNFEDDDFVEAWLEGSEDGINYSRFEGSTIIPRIQGSFDFRDAEASDPRADDLKKLQLPDGRYTTFSTAANSPIPAGIRFIRLRIGATNSSPTEQFFVDNLYVGLRSE